MNRLFFVAATTALILSGCQSLPSMPGPVQTGQPRGMVISASGSVRVKPTLAVLQLGASYTSPRPSLAKSQTEDGIKKIVAAIKQSGIAEEDIQTVDYKLYKSEDYRTRQISWTCTTGLEIRIKQVEQASKVLETALDAGANKVSGIEYTIEDMQTARAQARDQACKAAKAKADQYAKNFGVQLGAPIYIAENTPSEYQYRTNAIAAEYVAGARNSEQPLLSSGSLEVKISVDVTYDLKS